MLKRAKKRPFTGNRTNVISREHSSQEGLGNDMESSLKKNPDVSEGGELILENTQQNIQPNVNIRNTIKENIGEMDLLDTIPKASSPIISDKVPKLPTTVSVKFIMQFILFIVIIIAVLSMMCIEYSKYKIEQDRTELKRIQTINANFALMELNNQQ